jgi:predicted ATPase
MITKIEINGFKTFHDFKMEFSPLTVIIGANASGKSNLFDALMLLSRLAETDLKKAFNEQRGELTELFTQFSEDWYADEISFAVEMLINKSIRDNWGGEAVLKYTRLRYELKIQRRKNEHGLDDLYVAHESLATIKHREDSWVDRFIPGDFQENWRPKVQTGRRGIPYISTEIRNGKIAIKIPQDGRQGGKATPANAVSQTVLSGINSVDFPHAFAAKEEIRSWQFLQLNPQVLREPTRDLGLNDNITQSGANLAAALFRIKSFEQHTLIEISRQINRFLPEIIGVDVQHDKANKQFIIKVQNEDGKEFSSRVLSDGTLRLLALCILQFDDQHQGLICFEEPENGIHPFRMQAMAQLLKELSVDFSKAEQPLRQVIVNTHSPVLMGQIFELHADQAVKIWLSRLITRIAEFPDTRNPEVIESKKIKFHVTRLYPVESGWDKQLELEFGLSRNDTRLTKAEVINYLKTAEFETTIQSLKQP